jgi:RNA polymerase sigma factor (sigma-70 family)
VPGFSGRQVQCGDGDAARATLGEVEFEAIYLAHHTVVFAYAAGMCGPVVAADVTQEVFLAVWTGRVQYDPRRGSLRALLLTAAHNRVVDHIRSGTSRSRRELSTAVAGDAVEFEDEVIRGETATRVRHALAMLKDEFREPIVMAVYSDLTYSAVASALCLPEGTVKSRIRLGLRQMRRSLAASDGCASSSRESWSVGQ